MRTLSFVLPIAVATILLASPLVAQDHLISEPAIIGCTGNLYDSGGALQPYGNNESFTTVLCSGQVGVRMRLTFTDFSLAAGGTPADALAIYDGNSTSSALIGTYTISQLMSLAVTASLQNTTGCLTLVFTSNASATGNFAAIISCVLPCTPPTASATTALGDTARICYGETLILDGSASQATGGGTLTAWSWTVSNGTPTVSSTPMQTLSFPFAGLYRVELRVTDDGGCVSQPSTPVVVLVSGRPSFAGTTAPNLVCVPADALLLGNATTDPNISVLLPGVDYGTGAYLPDDVNQPFVSPVTISWAAPGSTVASVGDLGDICITMEHSYMGDLVINLACPNGQSVNLHQQGGGGTYIGLANDNDSNQNPIPGTCWTYCFNTNPDHDTWAACSLNGATPNVIGNSLAPGTYTSVQPLSNLVGCPVNGVWILTSSDHAGADNGFLCSWSLGIGAIVDSSFLDLAPTLALDHPDSTFWSGPAVITGGPANASAFIPTGGAYPFVFTVIDSYGCSYDTTLSVHGAAVPIVDAGPDVSLCSGPASLQGNVIVGPGGECTYFLIFRDTFGDGWNGGANLTCTLDGVSTTYTLPSGNLDTIALAVADGSEIVLTYLQGTVWNNENVFTLYSAQWDTLYSSPNSPLTGVHFTGVINCDGSPFHAGVQWTPTTGLVDPTDPETELLATAGGWYVLTAAYPGGLCAASDSVWVEPGGGVATLQWDAPSSMLCCDQNGMASYTWYVNGVLSTTTASNCLSSPTYGNWYVVAQPAAGCASFSTTTVVCPEIEIVHDVNALIATPGLGTYVWTYNGGVINNATGPLLHVQGNGIYTVTVTFQGCIATATYELSIITGVSDAPGAGMFKVVPNPNRGSFRLDLGAKEDGPVRIDVLDVMGRIAARMQFAGTGTTMSKEIALDLSPGTYQVKLTAGERTRSARMVVE